MRLLKSTAIIGSWTLVSRLLGLIRDILMAKYLGAGVINDALVTAVKLPNLFRRMFAEGAFNAAFVCLLYTSPSPRDATLSRMPSSA